MGCPESMPRREEVLGADPGMTWNKGGRDRPK